MATKSLHHKLK